MSERVREKERKKRRKPCVCLLRQRRKQEAGDANLTRKTHPNYENTTCHDHTKEGRQPACPTATEAQAIMSTSRSRPADLSLPADGGAWLKQSHQDSSDHLHHSHYNPGPSEHGDQHDDQQHHQQQQQQQQTAYSHPHQKPVSLHNEPRDQSFVYYNPNSNSSASDLTSPLTPTFSHHGGSHLRYASSTSSLDLQAAASSTCSDSPVSPPQPLQQTSHNANNTSTSTAKRLLPDVQEEPLERDGYGDGGLDGDDDRHSAMTMFTDDQMGSLYDCLCTSIVWSFPLGREAGRAFETPSFPPQTIVCTLADLGCK